MDQVTVLERGLRLVLVMARGKVLETDPRSVLGMGLEMGLQMVPETARDLVLVSAKHWDREKDQG